jgi:hypothetical protein
MENSEKWDKKSRIIKHLDEKEWVPASDPKRLMV